VGVEYANSAGIAEAPTSPSGEASKAASKSAWQILQWSAAHQQPTGPTG